jgi:hypothetical protein
MIDQIHEVQVQFTPRKLARVLADSLSPHKVRLTTIELVMPRIVLAEFNTHRQLMGDAESDYVNPFSRNSASSRAIPIEKMIERVIDDPYVPDAWGVNGKGMQAHGNFTDPDKIEECYAWYLESRDLAVEQAKRGDELGIHKQTVNRLIEPYMWHTVIATATEWSNFFNLRCHEAAHPAIRNTAEAARAAMAASKPTKLEFGEWHLPLVDERDNGLRRTDKIKLSVARCARVSYLTHEGIRDPKADLDLYERLISGGHMSPAEHVARPMSMHDVGAAMEKFAGVTCDRTKVNPAQHFSGNFRGWVQHRKTVAGEADILSHRAACETQP